MGKQGIFEKADQQGERRQHIDQKRELVLLPYPKTFKERGKRKNVAEKYMKNLGTNIPLVCDPMLVYYLAYPEMVKVLHANRRSVIQQQVTIRIRTETD